MYEHFNLRIHDDARIITVYDTTSWTVKVGAGDLASYKVDTVKDEAPNPKTDSVDIPGTNGIYDITEAAGRVFFENKNVTVTLSGATTESAMKTLWTNTLSFYHGHKCDFTFEDVSSVEWIRTGRVSIVMDYKNHQITFTFDAEPFAVKAASTIVNVPVVAKNLSSFTYYTAYGGSRLYPDDTANTFHFGVSAVNTEVIYRLSGLTAGDIFTLGIYSVIGGEITFVNLPGGDNKTKGVVSSGGYLDVRITVDGSYFEWQTVNDTLICYPAFRCSFILAKASSSGIITLPTNAMIHPEIANLNYPGTLIIDGAVFDITDTNNVVLKPPGAILPGYRAITNTATTDSIVCVIPKTTGQNPTMTLDFHKVEVR